MSWKIFSRGTPATVVCCAQSQNGSFGLLTETIRRLSVLNHNDNVCIGRRKHRYPNAAPQQLF